MKRAECKLTVLIQGGHMGRPIFETRLKVRSYECDSYGHVNNAVYLNYLEYGRMEALEAMGITLERLKREAGALVVIRRIHIEYFHPATMGDVLVIRTHVKEGRRSSGIFRQEIYRESDGKTIAAADVTWVFVNLQGRPIAIPPMVREAFQI